MKAQAGPNHSTEREAEYEVLPLLGEKEFALFRSAAMAGRKKKRHKFGR